MDRDAEVVAYSLLLSGQFEQSIGAGQGLLHFEASNFTAQSVGQAFWDGLGDFVFKEEGALRLMLECLVFMADHLVTAMLVCAQFFLGPADDGSSHFGDPVLTVIQPPWGGDISSWALARGFGIGTWQVGSSCRGTFVFARHECGIVSLWAWQVYAPWAFPYVCPMGYGHFGAWQHHHVSWMDNNCGPGFARLTAVLFIALACVSGHTSTTVHRWGSCSIGAIGAHAGHASPIGPPFASQSWSACWAGVCSSHWLTRVPGGGAVWYRWRWDWARQHCMNVCSGWRRIPCFSHAYLDVVAKNPSVFAIDMLAQESVVSALEPMSMTHPLVMDDSLAVYLYIKMVLAWCIHWDSIFATMKTDLANKFSKFETFQLETMGQDDFPFGASNLDGFAMLFFWCPPKAASWVTHYGLAEFANESLIPPQVCKYLVVPLLLVKPQNFQGLSLQMEEEVDILLAGQPITPQSKKVEWLLEQ